MVKAVCVSVVEFPVAEWHLAGKFRKISLCYARRKWIVQSRGLATVLRTWLATGPDDVHQSCAKVHVPPTLLRYACPSLPCTLEKLHTKMSFTHSLITKASHTIQYELDLHFKGNSKLKRTCFSVVAAVLYANEVQGHAPSDTLKNDAFSRETAPDWVVLKRSRAIESDLDQC